MKKTLSFISVLVLLGSCSRPVSQKTGDEEHFSTTKEQGTKDTIGAIRIQSHQSYDQPLIYEPEDSFRPDTLFVTDSTTDYD